MQKIVSLASIGLVALLGVADVEANSTLEERTNISDDNYKYQLYNYDTLTYFNSIDRQRVIDLIQDLSCIQAPTNSDSFYTSRFKFQESNIYYSVNYVRDTIRGKDVIYVLQHNFLTHQTNVIFDELDECKSRSIFGYSGLVDTSELKTNPTSALSLLFNQSNSLGSISELLYEEFIKKLERKIKN